MNKRKRILWLKAFGIFLFFPLSLLSAVSVHSDNIVSESWMGIFMEGVKVGYSHSLEIAFIEGGEEFTRLVTESWMKVSRLGGAPVEITSSQESLYKDDKIPLETVVRTKMSESEIVLKAIIRKDKILFMSGEKVVEEFPYTEKF